MVVIQYYTMYWVTQQVKLSVYVLVNTTLAAYCEHFVVGQDKKNIVYSAHPCGFLTIYKNNINKE